MKILENHDISDLFTWRVEARARYVVFIESVDDVMELCADPKFQITHKRQIIGRGSNTLFAESMYEGFVIVVANRGISLLSEDMKTATYAVSAGEDWHETVHNFVFDLNLAGMENLAYIPGTFGAAPVQNVGAYGQTLSQVVVEVETYDLHTGQRRVFTKDECNFAYRDSLFKKPDAKRYLIWSVTVCLKKPQLHDPVTDYHSNYESLASELIRFGTAPYTIQQVFQAVTALRKKKLPEVSEVGTNGSLFANPLVTGEKLQDLLTKFPKLQYYPTDGMKYPKNTHVPINNLEMYKIAAGHIFDELGWKGRRVGQVGTWSSHALVLCNYGTKKPGEIVSVIQMMQADFERVTGILLQPEINIVS